MSAGSKSGGQKQCCNPCGKCFKGSQPSRKTIKQSSSCCKGSKKGKGKWECTLRNGSELFGTRCEGNTPDAQWKCKCIFNWSGSPQYNNPGCPKDKLGCVKAMVAAQKAVEGLYPDEEPTTAVNWQPAAGQYGRSTAGQCTCTSIAGPGAVPCYSASDSKDPKKPDIHGTETEEEEATWDC